MHEPYRMVLINITASLVLLLGLGVYKFILKKKINLFYLLILISLLPILSVLRPGVYESSDFSIHIYRTISFYSSLSEGNIMPSWAGELNATYGYPLFVFNYTLPYYLISLIHFLGAGFIMSMKLFLAANYLASGIFMYLFGKKLFKNDLTSFTAAIFYLFAPYHLIDLHFKVVIGEILAFTLLPLLFLFIYNLNSTKKTKYIFLSAITFAALIASHIVIAMFASLISAAFVFFMNIKNGQTKIPFQTFIALFLGGLISLYTWLPPILMSQYTFVQKMNLELLPFPQILSLLYSPWRMGFLFQGHMGEISNLIGYTQIFVILYTVWVLRRWNLKKNANQIFWLAILMVLLFMLTPLSSFTWNAVPFLRIVGQHRLLLLVAFVIPILAGYFSQSTKRKIFVTIIIVVTIFSTILNWGNRGTVPSITDEVLISGLPESTYQGEAHFYANSKWVDVKNPWFKNVPTLPAEITSGKGKIELINKTSTSHIYNITATKPINVTENTLYFPGWKAVVDDKPIELIPSEKGLIAFSLGRGNHKVEITYEDIPLLRFSKIISVITLILTLILLVFNKKISQILHKRR